jgi:transposase
MSLLYGVKRDSAYRICGKRQYTTYSRGGARHAKLTELAMDLLLQSIEARPDMTLAEMKDLLQRELGIAVSSSAIARKLEGCLITMKKLELLPERRNSLENKEARRDFSEWLQQEHEAGAKFCFVDECGYGLFTARSRGRSVRGLPARRVCSDQRTPHITIMCSICPSLGVMRSQTMVGGAKQDDFDRFLLALLEDNFGQPL